MLTSLHHQWNTTPVWGSWLLEEGAVRPLSRELWRGQQGDMVWRNWLWLHTSQVSVFSALSFRCSIIYALHAVLNDATHSMLHCYTHLVSLMPAWEENCEKEKCWMRQFYIYCMCFSKWCPPRWLANRWPVSQDLVYNCFGTLCLATHALAKCDWMSLT